MESHENVWQGMHVVSRQEGDTAWATTPICDWGQSEVKRSRLKLVKQTIKAMVKASVAPGTQWAWLMQGSRLNFQCSQGVEHENLMVKNFDPSCGWKYRQLCSVQWRMQDSDEGVSM